MTKNPIVSCQECNYTGDLDLFEYNGVNCDEESLRVEYKCPRCDGVFEHDLPTKGEKDG